MFYLCKVQSGVYLVEAANFLNACDKLRCVVPASEMVEGVQMLAAFAPPVRDVAKMMVGDLLTRIEDVR